MNQRSETIQQFGKSSLEAVLKSVGATSKGTQAIAAEQADYAKRSFEQGAATLEKLLGVRTLDKAVEVQTGYAKAAYERFLAQTAKVGGLYVEHARPVFGPFEGLAAFSVKTPTAPAR
jgi:hypothetical protein